MFFGTQPKDKLFLPERMGAPELLIPGRKPVSSEVEIDKSHQWTGKLIGATIGSGPLLRQGSGVTIKQGQSRAAAGERWAEEANGDAFLFPGADLLIYARFTVANFSVVRHIIYNAYYTNATDNGGFYVSIETDGSLQAVQRNNNTPTPISTGAGTVSLNTTYFLKAHLFDGGFHTLDLYDEYGASVTSASGSTSVRNESGSHSCVVGSAGGLFVDWLYVFDAELSGWKVNDTPQALYDNPYSILKPKAAPLTTYTPDVRYPLADARAEMPSLWIPKRKPVGPVEIDWEHPLARGLENYFIHQDGVYVDIVNHQPVLVTQGTLTVDPEQGQIYDQPGTGTGATITGSPVTGNFAEGVTSLSLIYPDSVASTFTIIHKGRERIGGANGFPDYTLYARTSDPYLRAYASDGTNYTDAGSAANQLSANAWQWAVGWFNASRTTKTWVNKLANAGSGTTTGGGSNFIGDITSTDSYRFGGSRTSGGTYDLKMNGKRALDIVYGRALAEEEIFAIQDNPYQFLIPQ